MSADDTAILWSDKRSLKLETKVQNDFQNLKRWCEPNSLTLNTNKTNILCFKCDIGNVSLDLEQIINFQVNQLLGLQIDNKQVL